MFLTCSELIIFMYRTGNSANNLSSYCGLLDAKIRASDIYLPVPEIKMEYLLVMYFSTYSNAFLVSPTFGYDFYYNTTLVYDHV